MVYVAKAVSPITTSGPFGRAVIPRGLTSIGTGFEPLPGSELVLEQFLAALGLELVTLARALPTRPKSPGGQYKARYWILSFSYLASAYSDFRSHMTLTRVFGN